ncbi:ADP-ribosylglycohydrolase family protein [Nocardiopsis suaedae]|uniref:ADP-ribosylglycohydrolase family protein n=1 Tax=Nocardiopsis suaedae TaxID=3018444 RepID=A0ABT4TNI7_9ACTN|nr:ADP-ribosylglycohydrolase family protein [Nocardiopsis suaedae]MDA2805677.1 ADP-ribosylglycohydrolase family protein [Nocardiopsis suaedae]
MTIDADTPPPGSRLDRAAGVLLGAACGDALGVPYEFAARLDESRTPEMVGGGLGPYAPGEYSDDTQMAVCLAEAALKHTDMAGEAARRRVAEAFLRWRREGATDIGMQTSAVLDAAAPASGTPEVAEAMFTAARRRYESGVPSAGNGSLMRTAPLALSFLDDPEGLAAAAALYSDITHADPLAEEACVLWCEGIRHAVVHGGFGGVREGLRLLPEDHRARWAGWLDEAESRPPHAFENNGFVVMALQAAWSAVARTQEPEGRPEEHFRLALEAAVRAGNDTDTVAAIAGGLLGARWGASAVPPDFRSAVHGWPGLTGADLAAMAVRIATGEGQAPDPRR